MKERIIEFLRSENKSSAQFAEEIGVQPSGISHILSGRNNPSLDFVMKMLSRYPWLSADWLLFGKGTMRQNNSESDLFKDIYKKDSPSEETQTESVAAGSQENAGISEKVPSAVSIPSVGKHSERIIIVYNDGTFNEFFHAG